MKSVVGRVLNLEASVGKMILKPPHENPKTLTSNAWGLPSPKINMEPEKASIYRLLFF